MVVLRNQKRSIPNNLIFVTRKKVSIVQNLSKFEGLEQFRKLLLFINFENLGSKARYWSERKVFQRIDGAEMRRKIVQEWSQNPAQITSKLR